MSQLTRRRGGGEEVGAALRKLKRHEKNAVTGKQEVFQCWSKTPGILAGNKVGGLERAHHQGPCV